MINYTTSSTLNGLEKQIFLYPLNKNYSVLRDNVLPLMYKKPRFRKLTRMAQFFHTMPFEDRFIGRSIDPI